MINVKQPCRGASVQALMMLKCNCHCSWVSTREQGLQLPLTWTRTLNAKIWLSINQPTSDVPGSLSVLRLSAPGVAAPFPIPLPQVPGDIVVVKGLPTAGWHQVKAWTLYSTVFKIASSLPSLVSLREDAERNPFFMYGVFPQSRLSSAFEFSIHAFVSWDFCLALGTSTSLAPSPLLRFLGGPRVYISCLLWLDFSLSFSFSLPLPPPSLSFGKFYSVVMAGLELTM